jgi:hypothetical protein
MMKRVILPLALAALSLLPALPAAAQQQPGHLGIGYTVRVKMGSGLEFETALKQHVAWLKQQNETWTWHVWQKATGPNLNEYAILSSGHTLADLDAHAAFDKAMVEHWEANVAQLTTKISATLTLFRNDISHPLPGDMTSAVAMVYREQLKPGSEETFNYVARKVNEAIKKSNWPVHYLWEQPINGTEGPVMVRVALRSNWAGFQPPSQDLRTMLEGVYGREEANSLLHMAEKIIVSESSASYVFRPDLSYTPTQ